MFGANAQPDELVFGQTREATAISPAVLQLLASSACQRVLVHFVQSAVARERRAKRWRELENCIFSCRVWFCRSVFEDMELIFGMFMFFPLGILSYVL